MFHVMNAQCVAHDLHMLVPWYLSARGGDSFIIISTIAFPALGDHMQLHTERVMVENLSVTKVFFKVNND